jgi:hypothetical protein
MDDVSSSRVTCLVICFVLRPMVVFEPRARQLSGRSPCEGHARSRPGGSW